MNPNFSISTNWANQAIYIKSIVSIINLTSNSSLNTMKQLKIKSRSFKSGSTTLEQQLGFINLKRIVITTIVTHFLHYTCSTLSSKQPSTKTTRNKERNILRISNIKAQNQRNKFLTNSKFKKLTKNPSFLMFYFLSQAFFWLLQWCLSFVKVYQVKLNEKQMKTIYTQTKTSLGRI